MVAVIDNSSVAMGGAAPPIGMQSMQNTTFLALLRPIFALKEKIAPPHWHWQWKREYFDSGLKESSITEIASSLGEDLFLVFT